MDKKDFNRITKEVFVAYGFIKKRETFLLIFDEITISCRLYTWNLVRSFNYWISVNGLYDDSTPYEKRYDTYIAVKMEHSPLADGYHRSEIKYEDYAEEQYRNLLTEMLHTYFDPYKQNSMQYIKDNYKKLHLKPEGIAFLKLENSTL
jgi:hypothetical protein